MSNVIDFEQEKQTQRFRDAVRKMSPEYQDRLLRCIQRVLAWQEDEKPELTPEIISYMVEHDCDWPPPAAANDDLA